MKKNLFKEIKNYDELKKCVTEEVMQMKTYIFHPESKIIAMESFYTEDKMLQEKIKKFAVNLDKNMECKYLKNNNAIHKIPTLFSASIYLNIFYEKIKALTLEELTLLSKYSVMIPYNEYEKIIDKYPKDILNIINIKGQDIFYKTNLMLLCDKYYEQNIEKCDIIRHYEETPIENLLQEANEYIKQRLEEEMIKDEGRRF